MRFSSFFFFQTGANKHFKAKKGTVGRGGFRLNTKSHESASMNPEDFCSFQVLQEKQHVDEEMRFTTNYLWKLAVVHPQVGHCSLRTRYK